MSDNLKNVAVAPKSNNENNGQNNNNQKPPKMYGRLQEDAYLKFDWDPFKAAGKISFSTNKEICERIKAKFAQTFHDLEGVMLYFNGNTTSGKPPFDLQFFFANNPAPVPDTKIKNVVSLVDVVKNTDNFYELQKARSNSAIGNYYTLSDETKLLLSNFMLGGRSKNMPNSGSWNGHINVFTVNVPNAMATFINPNANKVIVSVRDLDIRAILKYCLYGSEMVTETVTDADGNSANIMSQAHYDLTYGDVVSAINQIFSIKIDQFDPNAIAELFNKTYPYASIPTPGIKYF